jgi:hypothetical protein
MALRPDERVRLTGAAEEGRKLLPRPARSLATLCALPRRVARALSRLLASSAARSLRIPRGTRLDERLRIRSDRPVLGIPGSRLAARAANLAARVTIVLRNACRPSGVAAGFIADLTRSRAELITENALLRQ